VGTKLFKSGFQTFHSSSNRKVSLVLILNRYFSRWHLENFQKMVTDRIDLLTDLNIFATTGAYALYYRLGKNIDFAYMAGCPSPNPSFQAYEGAYLMWDLEKGEVEWGYPNTVDLALYKKDDIEVALRAAEYVNPNELEGHWRTSLSGKKGLCYPASKVTNLILNYVTDFRGRSVGEFSCEQLNKIFLSGQKLDITPFQLKHYNAPHIAVRPNFVER
jgi:hypothetical protein